METDLRFKCPTEDEILASNRISLRLGSDVERAVRRMAKEINGKELTASEIQSTWNAIAEHLASLLGAHPLTRGLLNMAFDNFVTDTFTDNPALVAELLGVQP